MVTLTEVPKQIPMTKFYGILSCFPAGWIGLKSETAALPTSRTSGSDLQSSCFLHALRLDGRPEKEQIVRTETKVQYHQSGILPAPDCCGHTCHACLWYLWVTSGVLTRPKWSRILAV